MESLLGCLQFLWNHWILTLFCILLTYLYFDYLKMRKTVSSKGLKGPSPLPLVGNLATFMRDFTNSHLTLEKLTQEYGSRFMIHVLRFPALVATDPEDLKEIYVKQFDKFHDRTGGARKDVPEPLASALIHLTGSRWKNVRSILSPSFTSGKLRKMMFIMNRACKTLSEKLQCSAGKEDDIDITKWLNLVTMEVILSAAFGIATNPQTDDDDQVIKYAKKALKPPSGLLKMLSIIPFIGQRIKMRLILSKYGFDVEDILRVTNEIIRQRKQNEVTEDAVRYDILHLMLESQKEDHKGPHLSNNEVLGQSLTFLMAGNETTWATASVVIYHLTIHPDIQAKAQEEIDQFLEQDVDLTYEHLQKMVYVDACVLETLRLFPPGSITTRAITGNVELSGNLRLEKGSIVMIPIYAMHHNPKYWNEPDKFIPDRFLPGEKEKIDPYVYMPFGQGPRNCIGMRFALMEVKSIVVSILRSFDLKPAPKLHIPLKIGSTGLLKPLEPIYVRVSNRNKLGAET